MKILNLTPHRVCIYKKDDAFFDQDLKSLALIDNATMPVAVFEPCGVIPRVSKKSVQVGEIDGIPLMKSVFGEVVDLPAPENDTIYIVAQLVRAACDRDDLVFPENPVRDSQGRIIGATAFGR
jgi:hypothetical protein